jgi:hypothetical protein
MKSSRPIPLAAKPTLVIDAIGQKLKLVDVRCSASRSSSHIVQTTGQRQVRQQEATMRPAAD